VQMHALGAIIASKFAQLAAFTSCCYTHFASKCIGTYYFRRNNSKTPLHTHPLWYAKPPNDAKLMERKSWLRLYAYSV